MRLALGIEYDGSRFLGWQTQPDGGAVQDALESALSGIAGEALAVTCAGRTDRGVHALEQVVHLDTVAARPLSAWVRGVNATLPESVAVLWAHHVPEDFHARYSAVSRTYRYVLLNRAVRPALAARHVGWFHAPLDVDAMREAALHLVGERDFSAFRSSECQARSPVRMLHELTIEQRDERIDFVVRANAFLHHMVRNIVGTLVYVGKGKHPPGWVREVLESRDRGRAAPTFASEGLYLEKVHYDPRWNLPARAARALEIAA
ncbi:tRNA pseudouridine(38-40) synthase TruA [Brevundimonas sp.]|uniref:tRNA pseudouridine(38-40) synthase TruA n=1 Tax=Brevundimonas sp. TaxID=1871086 RepID=UPI002D31769A|nr:tRNA pseudouridine(38-40) synthase TruA [Brevundimonas sp.]HYC69423.1 tRNA pseudouridine(38-40) synthase TruA [Brevundimonas sp.]